MEIKIYSSEGELVAERHYLEGDNNTDTDFLLSDKSNGVYIAKIMYDGIVKTRKLKIR